MENRMNGKRLYGNILTQLEKEMEDWEKKAETKRMTKSENTLFFEGGLMSLKSFKMYLKTYEKDFEKLK